MKRAVLAVALAVIAVASACGGAAKSAADAPPQSPPGYVYSQSGPPAQPLPPQAGYPPGTPEGQPGGGLSREAALGKARSELDEAQRELDVATSDCFAACRALGSMDRATGHLCGLALDGDERSRCEDAKTKLRGARDKVKTTCGTCPGGVTVDRNAPVPSPSPQ
jgi:hypothetical protein